MKSRLLFAAANLICIFMTLPSLSSADTAEYLYDDTGRLIKADTGTERANYYYDAVGNLLFINRDEPPPLALPPVLQTIDPDILLTGAHHTGIITGQHLKTTSSITSNSPDVTIRYGIATETTLPVSISVAADALPGQVLITVESAYGSASIPVSLHKAQFNPATMTLFPGNPGLISAALVPAASRDFNMLIMNLNPDVIETPREVTVPAGQSTQLSVKGLSGGTAVIHAGSATSVVFVTGSGEPVVSQPVSVRITATGVADAAARPVSVAVIVTSQETAYSVPVSVTPSMTSPATAYAQPVSAMIQND